MLLPGRVPGYCRKLLPTNYSEVHMPGRVPGYCRKLLPTNYSEVHRTLLPGRVPGYCRKLLPSSVTKLKDYRDAMIKCEVRPRYYHHW